MSAIVFCALATCVLTSPGSDTFEVARHPLRLPPAAAKCGSTTQVWSEAKAPAFVEDKSIGWRVMHETPADGAGDRRSPRVACVAQLV